MKKLLLIVAAILLIGGLGFGVYALLDDEQEDNSTDTVIETNQESASEEGATTSQPTNERADTSDSYAVSLDELGVSFLVPNNIEAVQEVTTYKRFPNPSVCDFIGQRAGEEIGFLILAGETGSGCVNLTEFDDAGERTVAINGTEFTLRTYESRGNSGDILIAEQANLDNDVTISFLYKTNFKPDVQGAIESVLSSFEVESVQ